MKFLLLSFIAAVLFGCNSSSSKKDPDADTARGDNNSASTATGAVNPVKITVADIPSSIIFKGKLYEAWKWSDLLGKNILVTSIVDANPNRDEVESSSAELHAFHYVFQDTGYVQQFAMHDAVKTCPFDITCRFIKDATTVTDLDKDGIAEIKLQYSLACRSDVSPADMKLLVYEDGVKYALRGVMWIKESPEDKFTVTENDVNLEKLPKKKDEFEQMIQQFGRYESEKEFTNAPPEFLSFARTEWLKYVKESIGEEE